MALNIKRPNGTEDVTGKNIRKWHTVERTARDAAAEFGFHEIRIPTFENTELFQRSVGETTDVVQKEMYSVIAKETKFTLRPEGTAGTIRAMLQNGLLNEALPQKAFYILSCFRHERPQAGRLREFHQFGVEMAGSKLPSADADVILLAHTIISQLGIKNVELKINSIGCPKCRAEYHKALKAYFEKTESAGAYLIAEEYVRKIANFAENGRISTPDAYKNAKNGSRLPAFIEKNNARAGYTVCDHQSIFIRDGAHLNPYEKLAILATYTADVSFPSFAAEVQYHACFLTAPARIPVPFLGHSIYDSAIRADMTIDDCELEGPAPFHNLKSHWVRRQEQCHPEYANL